MQCFNTHLNLTINNIFKARLTGVFAKVIERRCRENRSLIKTVDTRKSRDKSALDSKLSPHISQSSSRSIDSIPYRNFPFPFAQARSQTELAPTTLKLYFILHYNSTMKIFNRLQLLMRKIVPFCVPFVQLAYSTAFAA